MMNSRLPIPLLLAALLFGLLQGCAQAPTKAPKPVLTPAQSQQLAEAASFEASGDFTAAAAVYEQLAAGAASPQRDRWLLQAADARLRGGDIAAAETLLGQLQSRLLPPRGQLLARLVGAEIHLSRNRPRAALGLLNAPPYRDAPTELKVRFLRDRSEGLRLSGDLLGSARALSELDLLVVKRIDRLDNQLQLLRTLTTLQEDTLKRLRPTATGVFGGWMDLAHILLIYQNTPEATSPLLAQWHEINPSHPALPNLFKHYLADAGVDLSAFGRVAVLLPTSGRYAKAAAAVRDGLLAAYYAAPAQRRPELSFYDSSNPAHIQSLLQQAIAEGAGAAIGPLQKEAVRQLAQAGRLEIPVLTLNRIPSGTATPDRLFQFGLAPEDEAAQAADKAWADGAVTALALVPQGEWGERLLSSFTERWESLGGELNGYATYDPEAHDFTGTIRALLRQERNRNRQLAESAEGQESKPTPRRRRASALFLAANWTRARQLWPQLQFNTSADMAVYTTSHIYTGRFNHPQDLDLVGLTFPDIPWVLAPKGRGAMARENLPPELAGHRGALARLFALGMDSYRLLASLQRMRGFPATRVSGATGDLYLDRRNLVHRRLLWARMTRSGPKSLGFTPEPYRTAAPMATTGSAPTTAPAPAAGSVSRGQGR